MKTPYLAITIIFLIGLVGGNVSVFADNGTLKLGPPPKIPVQQVYPENDLLSPLEQFKMGKTIDKIHCIKNSREFMILVLRAEDQSPACVFSSHYTALAKRGWIYKYSFNDIASETARQFMLSSSPTFRYDGIEKTLTINITFVAESLPPIVTIQAYFDAAHPGYGNRTGLNLPDHMTGHSVLLGISNSNEVTYAVIDRTWDELHQRFLDTSMK